MKETDGDVQIVYEFSKTGKIAEHQGPANKRQNRAFGQLAKEIFLPGMKKRERKIII